MYFSALMSKSTKTFSCFLMKNLVNFLSLNLLVKVNMATVWSKSLTCSVSLLNLVTKSRNGSSCLCLTNIKVIEVFLCFDAIYKMAYELFSADWFWLQWGKPKSCGLIEGGRKSFIYYSDSCSLYRHACSKHFNVVNRDHSFN